jgi:mono/diheme cytochrome c family protein
MSSGRLRRALRVAVAAGGLLLVLLVALATYVKLAPLPRYQVRPSTDRVELTPERIDRGRRIAAMRCLDCHLDNSTGRATGRRMTEIPEAMGTSYAANLTADPKTGIGEWTDGELVYTLRTGVARDGRLLVPWMPRLRGMADEDVRSVVAYLRSGDALFAPTKTTNESSPSMLARALLQFKWKPAPMPDAPIDAPPMAETIAYGGYVVDGLAGCWACHSGDFTRLNHEEPRLTPGYLAGGTELVDASGSTVISPNITLDAETGIGKWSADDFAHALRTGVRPDGSVLRYPMPQYAELTDDEIAAAYSYLRSVPAVQAGRPKPSVGLKGTSDHEHPNGSTLYRKYGCSSCHGDEGVGIADLRAASKRFPTDAELEAWIRRPSKLRPGVRMPDYDGVIKDEHFPPLIQHVRQLERP